VEGGIRLSAAEAETLEGDRLSSKVWKLTPPLLTSAASSAFAWYWVGMLVASVLAACGAVAREGVWAGWLVSALTSVDPLVQALGSVWWGSRGKELEKTAVVEDDPFMAVAVESWLSIPSSSSNSSDMA
jgi:hypothetical protein